MEVRWSPSAAEDLERICERIERDNPEAARRVARSIYDGCDRLKDFPNVGRASRRMAGRRARLAIKRPPSAGATGVLTPTQAPNSSAAPQPKDEPSIGMDYAVSPGTLTFRWPCKLS
jgi:plasmid stabilization system protein ParE